MIFNQNQNQIFSELAALGAGGCSAPAPPTDINIDDSSTQGSTTVIWVEPGSPDTTEIWKSTDGGSTFAFYDFVAGGIQAYNDAAPMTDGDLWYYAVRSCNSTCCSAFSEMRGVAANAFMATEQSMPFLVIAYGTADFSLGVVGALDLQRLRFVRGSLIAQNQPDMTAIDVSVLLSVDASFDLGLNPALTGLTAPVLTTVGGSLILSSAATLTTVEFPALTSVGGEFLLDSCPALGLLTISALVSVGGSINLNGTGDGTLFVDFSALGSIAGDFSAPNSGLSNLAAGSLGTIPGALDFSASTVATVSFQSLMTVSDIFGNGCLSMTAINLDALQTVSNLNLSASSSLASANFPSIVAINGTFNISNSATLAELTFADGCSFGGDVLAGNCVSLQALTIGVAPVISDGFQWNFNNCAILTGDSVTAVGVDGVLRQCADNAVPLTGLNLDLSGGTSEPPSAAGLADEGILIGNGCSVVTN